MRTTLLIAIIALMASWAFAVEELRWAPLSGSGGSSHHCAIMNRSPAPMVIDVQLLSASGAVVATNHCDAVGQWRMCSVSDTGSTGVECFYTYDGCSVGLVDLF